MPSLVPMPAVRLKHLRKPAVFSVTVVEVRGIALPAGTQVQVQWAHGKKTGLSPVVTVDAAGAAVFRYTFTLQEELTQTREGFRPNLLELAFRRVGTGEEAFERLAINLSAVDPRARRAASYHSKTLTFLMEVVASVDGAVAKGDGGPPMAVGPQPVTVTSGESKSSGGGTSLSSLSAPSHPDAESARLREELVKRDKELRVRQHILEEWRHRSEGRPILAPGSEFPPAPESLDGSHWARPPATATAAAAPMTKRRTKRRRPEPDTSPPLAPEPAHHLLPEAVDWADADPAAPPPDDPRTCGCVVS
jgi:hypothetical protein